VCRGEYPGTFVLGKGKPAPASTAPREKLGFRECVTSCPQSVPTARVTGAGTATGKQNTQCPPEFFLVSEGRLQPQVHATRGKHGSNSLRLDCA